ncbi:MAG TPA: ATP-binding protein [Nitrospirales bacterium]|jgi:signal transduction histidine kinase/CheY-like chemotaxis protein
MLGIDLSVETVPSDQTGSGRSSSSTNRSQLLLLQILITVVLCYQLLFSKDTLISFEAQEILVLGLMLLLGGLIVFPARFWTTHWMIGAVVISDTVLTTAIIYLSGNAASDLYLTYFLVILIAALSPTLKQMLGLSVVLCVSYGVYLAIEGSTPLLKGQFLRIPVLLILAVFYGVSTERVRADMGKREVLEDQLRQSQKLEAIGRLAGGIAHDFNNILTAIMGYSSLIQSGLEESDPTRQEVEEIKKAVRRASSLIQQLLAFSRRQVLRLEVLDLNLVVLNTQQLLQRLIGEDIELIIRSTPALGHVKADPGQIEQVLMNLSLNARDAMPQGGKVTIETANVTIDAAFARRHLIAEAGPYIILSVTDTGSGMDAETQAHIFEPFFTTKEHGKGTGLGLATVYGIVKQSRGSIFVYSKPGKGVTCKIYLPRVNEPLTTVEFDTASFEPSQGSETILLVEDEDSVREPVRKVLQRIGYTVLEARHGKEALDICRQYEGEIPLLVTDVVMPRMSGREVAEQLMASRPNIKVLYLSGYTDDEVLRHGVSESVTAFLQKPFTPEALARKVRDVLDAGRNVPLPVR